VIVFHHVLLPTDGSEVSARTIEKTIALAKSVGASVTGLHVAPPFHIFSTHNGMSPEEWEKEAAGHATEFLGRIEKCARDAGLACDTVYLRSDRPHEAIVKTAAQKGCDLIAMGTHGWTGLKGAFGGSETEKVLESTDVPVLVFH
jgi:nucleotide-binding universal stress UspA family protein